MSGAGEYICRVFREMEEIGVLANDGGSDVLYHRLVHCADIEVH